MSIDYQQLRKQIKELGKSAPLKQEELRRKRQEADGVVKELRPGRRCLAGKSPGDCAQV